jgi:hypothetical protein
MVRTAAAFVIAVVGVSCRHATKPPAEPTPADCGDRADLTDACPLVDGCRGASQNQADEDEDGCPGAGGVPYATGCRGDEKRFAAIAAEIGRRPKLTKLRIVSRVRGCPDLVREGLERAGVPHTRLEVVEEAGDPRCDEWARFEIAAWEGRSCGP